MAFVNEYITEDDVAKYGIREIWAKFRTNTTGRSNRTKFDWTIDREKDVFFIPAKSGKEEFSNQIICILWWKGVYLSVTLRKFGPPELPNNTIRWDLESIWRPDGFSVLDKEIKPILKEALEVYGIGGVEWQIADLNIQFGF